MPSRARRDEQFSEFVRERSPRLRMIARAICFDPDLADDLVQEALERTYVAWPKLTDDPMPWTRRVLVNLNTDRLRRRRAREVGDDALEAADSRDSMAAVLDNVVLADLLAGLTERERAVLALRYLEDLSEADTARELGVATGTVKSATNRALGRIRSLVADAAVLH